ncbi:4Fe-4S binding protein (plasmid) [Methanosphaera sp. ISO3-F5]|uniref:4Fe-4S binding protein n=1 Tax=Methanosphaera sp. ISO3-F5 TaxID=1452353 RepID=UPI002B258709|nr:4Fe-4S binding protein [Methanosphaera sp. ISO3-F5]WQH65459.1 4Fe-4S binding protein [Methanosphaera sp. ISO3-F5]
MITKKECLEQIREVIDGVLSTVDENGNSQSRIIDIMHIDEDTIYFLTARGKNVYKELINHPQISYVNLKDNKSVRINGIAKKLDDQKKWIDLMFEENPFMNNVYPGESRYILEPFKVVSGEIEYFDLTQKPIFRQNFKINNGTISEKGYLITEKCIECRLCAKICPQKIINEGKPYTISKENCLHCGLCYENCPAKAIKILNK